MKKVGIMGGTFNPIHYGHLFLAENAYEQLGLDKVLFMPTKNPPHKAKPNAVTDQQRVDMISLAISDNPHFDLSTLELEREGTTYTADTLTILNERHPEVEYYFLVGTDSLFMMQDWYKPQTIFDLCTVVVAGRDNVDKEQIDQHIKFLNTMYQARIIALQMPTIQIASAVIRERIGKSKTVRYYVPAGVMDYIMRNSLYAGNTEDERSGLGAD